MRGELTGETDGKVALSLDEQPRFVWVSAALYPETG